MKPDSILTDILFLLIGAIPLGIWSFYAIRQSYRRGRSEVELETAPLREKAAGLEVRLRETETDSKTSREALQEASNQRSTFEEKSKQIPRLEEEIQNLKTGTEQSSRELLAISRTNAELKTELQGLRDREPEMREALQQVAAKFLKENGTEFATKNLESLNNLLTPLSLKLKEFETKVETTHQQERDQHTQLKTQIELLYQMNQNLGQEAKNLTQALKGENKTGGNWGEVVLERVLEVSGLEKGREFKLQTALRNDDGKSKLPDAIIYLPGNRTLVIDSKLSLVAYERYCSAESPEQAKIELDAHTQSIRQHVKNLSAQRYQDLPELQTVDFVFLFMPVEPAFIEAVKNDPTLFQEAWDKHILIVSPSTLLATLRTVENIWKQEYRNRYATEIARQAGLLHEKFVGFLTDLGKVGDSIAKANASFEEAKKKLKDGTGNLIKKTDDLKKLGVKVRSKIPEPWQDALEEEVETEATEDPRLLE